MSDPERKVVPFTTPEMIELKRLQKERDEEQERLKRLVEKWEMEWEQKQRSKREGRLKVAEWCFVNFKFFEPTYREIVGHKLAREMACTRFRRHRVRCFDGAGGGSWRDGSLRGSSSLRLCA
jgi:hypothetical protein